MNTDEHRSEPIRIRMETVRSYLCSSVFICGFWLSAAPALAQKSEPWSTFRGNAQRTGSTDGLPGPQAAKVLWAYKSPDHHMSSPVPMGDRLLLSGLTGFNVGFVNCISTEIKPKKRELWTKTTPLLKLPTVSSPALLDGAIIFGDGMHQTNGAAL